MRMVRVHLEWMRRREETLARIDAILEDLPDGDLRRWSEAFFALFPVLERTPPAFRLRGTEQDKMAELVRAFDPDAFDPPEARTDTLRFLMSDSQWAHLTAPAARWLTLRDGRYLSQESLPRYTISAEQVLYARLLGSFLMEGQADKAKGLVRDMVLFDGFDGRNKSSHIGKIASKLTPLITAGRHTPEEYHWACPPGEVLEIFKHHTRKIQERNANISTRGAHRLLRGNGTYFIQVPLPSHRGILEQYRLHSASEGYETAFCRRSPLTFMQKQCIILNMHKRQLIRTFHAFLVIHLWQMLIIVLSL